LVVALDGGSGGPWAIDHPSHLEGFLSAHRSETFKLSTDPLFVEKVRDSVGLYRTPGEPHHSGALSARDTPRRLALS
jgi:hypothetical protein